MAIGQGPPRLDNRSSNMTDNIITRYRRTKLYIIDDKDINSIDPLLGSQVITAHDRKIQYILTLFTNLFDGVQINRKFFDQDASEREFHEYWDEHLINASADELLVIYFHGNAGNASKDYSWKLQHSPPGCLINAYDFIQKVHDSKVDALFILDCYIPTSIEATQWRWARNTRDPFNTSTTEIIVAPAPLQDPDGLILKHSRDFTEAIVGNLNAFVEELLSRKEQNNNRLCSLLVILGTDGMRYSRPIRIQLEQPRKKHRGIWQIKRLVIDPQLVQLTGKLELFAKEVQAGREF